VPALAGNFRPSEQARHKVGWDQHSRACVRPCARRRQDERDGRPYGGEVGLGQNDNPAHIILNFQAVW
jgi:hypothetical protein